ncbi:hypothetical protein B0H19DRAFT_1139311 [Mycena capillaripes]|nr:hypothetical protein B0H19DRAFT_1139311 [Mycena capillaripes]
MDPYGLKLTFLQITFEALSYGIFFTVGAISMYYLGQPGLRKSRARQVLLGLIITMLLGATVHLGLHLTSIILDLYPDSNPTTSRTLRLVQVTIRRLIYFLSDIIVVWRAWAIWRESLVVRAVLTVCLLATFVTSLTLYIFNIESTEYGRSYPALTQNFLGTFCLLLTNFIATALIGYKLWYYRRNLRQYLNRGNRTTKVESVLILLLESGGLYCAFWILMMLGDFGYFKDFGLEWVQPNVSGIYPTVIILVVSQRKMLSQEVLTYTAPSLHLHTLSSTAWSPTSPHCPRLSKDKDSSLNFVHPDRYSSTHRMSAES